MATAAAYGHALGIPVFGVCSLDAVGGATVGETLVVTDARRREVYWARYRGDVRIAGPGVIAPAELEAFGWESVEVNGHDAETRAAESVRERDDLTVEQWAERLQTYYSRLEALLWPDLFVVGGGVSKQADTFLPLLDLRTPVVAAKLKNKAGIIGASRLAAKGN